MNAKPADAVASIARLAFDLGRHDARIAEMERRMVELAAARQAIIAEQTGRGYSR